MLMLPRTGTFWYRMADPHGEPFGFARMEITSPADGGLHVDWELRLAFPGGTYEEVRTLTVDPAWRMQAATIRTGEGPLISGRREGERWFWSAEGSPEEHSFDLSERTYSGMDFVLAAALQPLAEGTTHEVEELNEAKGFEPVGAGVFLVQGVESLSIDEEELEVLRVVLTRLDGQQLPLWVSRDRTIARADWGGGNLMTLSRTPTRDLF
jgi:hypothetical protein